MTDSREEKNAPDLDPHHAKQPEESEVLRTLSVEVQTFPPGLIVWDRQ